MHRVEYPYLANKVYTFGTENPYSKKFVYSKHVSGNLNVQIELYVDEFPYKKSFTLDDSKAIYEEIISEAKFNTKKMNLSKLEPVDQTVNVEIIPIANGSYESKIKVNIISGLVTSHQKNINQTLVLVSQEVDTLDKVILKKGFRNLEESNRSEGLHTRVWEMTR